MLLPLYSALDRGLISDASEPARGRARDARAPIRRSINYLRVPAVVSGILLLVYFPLILGYSSKNYRNDTGHALAGYTRNWLLICAGLFLVSALVYAVRVIRSRPRTTAPRPMSSPALSRPRQPLAIARRWLPAVGRRGRRAHDRGGPDQSLPPAGTPLGTPLPPFLMSWTPTSAGRLAIALVRGGRVCLGGAVGDRTGALRARRSRRSATS